jgi:Inner membrane component of T3SS, cytoplasmic domain
MSFKLFVYYCALCGAWAGFFSWVFVNALFWVSSDLVKQTLIGCLLGFFLAAAIALVDAWLNGGGMKGLMRTGLAVGVSVLGSMICALIGQFLLRTVTKATAESSTNLSTFLGDIVTVFTWVLVGVIIGGSIGLYDLGRALLAKQGTRFSVSKIIKGCIGGAIGGFVGGFFLALCESFELLTYSKRAMGFVILGLSIGLLIGVAQVILKEAWLRVEQGFRPGRELMLVKEETVIGRAEACDLGLFGDNGVERKHARILLRDGRYMLYDESTPGGTFVNDQRIAGPTPLRSGDVIRLGRNVLVFGERQKRPA